MWEPTQSVPWVPGLSQWGGCEWGPAPACPGAAGEVGPGLPLAHLAQGPAAYLQGLRKRGGIWEKDLVRVKEAVCWQSLVKVLWAAGPSTHS